MGDTHGGRNNSKQKRRIAMLNLINFSCVSEQWLLASVLDHGFALRGINFPLFG